MSQKQIKSHFPNMLNELDNICEAKKVKIEKSSIYQMHRARNNVQHDGLLLEETQCKDFFAACEKALRNLCEKIFNISWESITLSLLIKDPKIAGFYKNAEKDFEKGKFQNAANNMIMAFESAKMNRQYNQFGSGIVFKKFETRDNETHDKKVLDYIVYSDLEVIKLGLDYKKWSKFISL